MGNLKQSTLAGLFSIITIGILTFLTTTLVGLLFLNFVPLPLYIIIPLAVGFGVGLMIFINVTHPPAGGNPIIVIMGSVSFDYLFSPVIIGSIIIIIFAIIINRLFLKKSYPIRKNNSFTGYQKIMLDAVNKY